MILMKSNSILRSWAFAFGFFVALTNPIHSEHPPPPSGFTALFNGKDLAGWHGMGHFDPRKLSAMNAQERQTKRDLDLKNLREHWWVEDGAIVNDGHGVYLTSDAEFGDIELLVDYQTVPKADSGIYLRGNPQIQIWDFTKEGGKWNLGADKGSGALWNNSPDSAGKDPIVLADKSFGEWNHFRIIQVGDRTTVFLNDHLVVDHAVMENFWNRKMPLWKRGPIQLQTHGGEIRWRNIYVRNIPPHEANRMLAEPGFKPIFNGTNLDGWKGATDNYEVQDGAMLCKSGAGGTIYYHQSFSDFVVRFEFRLPPGGNNGLAIRYPGSGDAAYDGMCELQVLDNSADKYAELDSRQYHGSAYGMVAAHRGFQRSIGEWNYQEVSVIGSTIKVELNGTTILHTDLDSVSDFLSKRPHSGKDRQSGYFGFAGHGDPVAFRNIRIKAMR